MGYALAVPVVAKAVSKPLWRALRAADGPVTIRDLHIASHAHPNAIQLRLRRWVRAGLVTSTDTIPRRFCMATGTPPTATPPEVSRSGTISRRVQNGRQRIWTAMRVLKAFDVPTLVMTSEATRRSVEDFVNVLMRAGWLRMSARGNPMRGDLSRYELVHRSGPTAPTVTRRATETGHVRLVIDSLDGTAFDVSPGVIALRGEG